MELKFRHNGNGTCCIRNIGYCTDTEINIPQMSPRGDIVTSIGSVAFSYCHDIKSITIPNSVTSIGNSAFCSCKGLTSITIPDSVTSIGDFAFSDCPSLTNITIPNSVKKLGKGAFYNCSSLTSITIPSSVKYIRGDTFRGCNSLESVTIQDGVTSIGDDAFWGCANLTSITIPSSVKSIGRYVFCNCDSLAKEFSIKATNGDITCRNFKFNLGEWYHEDEAELCRRGFHYVTNVFDVFGYYSGRIGKDVRFFKVMARGTSRKKSEDSKRVCTDICLYEEITSYKDLLN